MADEKRMIETYEVKHALHLSGGEVVLAEDASAARHNPTPKEPKHRKPER